MNRRVLIVAGSYAPVMAAEMHRARHLAWELPKIGWDVTILAPGPEFQFPCCVDPDGAAFFNPDTTVHLVSDEYGLPRMLGLRSIGFRALLPAYRAARQLLAEQRFDLVYFSTTQFPLFLLGPVLRKRAGVPFVLDFHDPCYKEGMSRPMWASPSPKHVIGNWLAKVTEQQSASRADGMIAVSPAYLTLLRSRYEHRKPPWIEEGRNAVIPFAASADDLNEVRGSAGPGRDAPEHADIIYVGAGGPIMVRCFGVLCSALSRLGAAEPELTDRVRIRLLGTMGGWLNGGPKHLFELAQSHGLKEMVSEDPSRVTFRNSLNLLLESDGALILGVDDAGYSPSKMYSYALSGKPLLAILRRDGPAFAQFMQVPELGHALWFDSESQTPDDEAMETVRTFLREVVEHRSFRREAVVQDFTAAAMAQRHADLFEACVRVRAKT